MTLCVAIRRHPANGSKMNLTDHAPSDVLHDYARLKLDLAAIVRTLLHSAEKNKDDLAIRDCRRVLAKLAEDRFNLAVVGQFSRGKSSLMNALLGMEKLPTGILPLTSVVTTVTYGEIERVLLLREGWTIPQEIRLDQLPEYVTQDRNPGNEKKVLLAEVQLPHELLRLGVQLVDTPGVASSIAANTIATRRFLPEADAAILVTSFESPMTEAEVAFLEELRTHVHRIFIVVNKLDLAADKDRQPVLETVRKTARAVLSESEAPVFAVSAKQALAAKKSGSAEELSKSGFPALEAALSDFLKRHKARESLLRAAARSKRIAQRQETSVRIAERSRRPEESQRLQERLTELSAQLTKERDVLVEAMRARLPEEFAGACRGVAPVWSSNVEAAIASQIESWFATPRSEVSGPAFQDFIQATLQAQFAAWENEHRRSIDAQFDEIARRESAALEGLIAAITELPSNILEEQALPQDEAAAPSSLEPPRLAFRELQVALTNFEVPWWYDLLPERLLYFMARRWKRRVPELAEPYERAAASLFSMAVNDWIDTVSRELCSRIDGATQQMRELLTRGLDSDATDLDNVIERLNKFMQAVIRIGNDSPEAYSSMTLSVSNSNPELASTKPCKICLSVEKTLRDFMAQRQYELAVNESDQRNHALRSGFCPVHTWQYEAIASPQGVCAAYSELLQLCAKRLRLIAENETAIQSMASQVRAMLPTQESCAACQIAASTEKAMAREIAKTVRDREEAAVSLCVFHLRSVLLAGPDRKFALRLLEEEARAFERQAENMQNHVLKHEAVRHHLATEAERKAAVSGLARLVGRRNVVYPWKIE